MKKNKNLDQTSWIAIGILFTIILSLGFRTIDTIAWNTIDVDSTAYHLPIAENLLKGSLLDFESILHFYPASAHVLLALFLLLPLPPLWFNAVLSLLCVAGVSYLVARSTRLSINDSILFSFVITTLTPVIRIYDTFKIDNWFLIAYLLLVLFFTNLSSGIKETNLKKWIYYGSVVVGLLIGIKYTGIVYLPFFLLIFYADMIKVLRRLQHSGFNKLVLLLVVCSSLIFISGGIWYFRNYLVTGDALYPRSDPTFSLGAEKSHPLFMHMTSVGRFFTVFQAFISEYLLWGVLILFSVLTRLHKTSITINTHIHKLHNLSLIHLGCFLFLIPFFSTGAIISDMRYVLGPIAIGILYMQHLAIDNKMGQLFTVLAFLGAVPAITLSITHQPKLIVLVSIILLLGFSAHRAFFQR